MAPRSTLLAATLLVLAICTAWSNSLGGPLVLDDLGNIADNPTIRDLSALRTILSPPTDTGVGGRPVLNLSYALNYALTGPGVTGLHVTNLLIHVLAALTLFALLRHTLRSLNSPAPTVLALLTAALWALHPVQTQSVTYLSQRAESLMGLCYLLTLYCAARHLSPSPLLSVSPSPTPSIPPSPLRRSPIWPIAAVLACALGLATKEITVTAPLLVLLYDRCFVSGTWIAALRTRPRFYLALASTWILLAVLLADVGHRGIGSEHGVTPFTYALTSCRTLVHYLCLSLWPDPLVFDYGPNFVRSASAIFLHALLLLALLAATLHALARRPHVGFAAAAFFLLLAPTTSVVPIAFSPVAESRLYLPLAAVITLLVLTVHRFARHRTILLVTPLALLCGTLTFARNRTYATDLALWTDTVAKVPASANARYNLGLMLSRAGRTPEAIAQWRATLALDPSYAAAHNNLANALASSSQVADSVPHYEAALRRQPDASVVRANFGAVLHTLGRHADAAAQLHLAIKQSPANGSAYNNLGLVLEAQQRPFTEILSAYETALRLEPTLSDAHHNLGLLLSRHDRLAEALTHLETVVRLKPHLTDPRLTLARVFLIARRPLDARPYIEETLRLFPTSPDAHLLHGNCLAYLNDFPAAIAAFERALALRPDFPDASANLAIIRARLPAK